MRNPRIAVTCTTPKMTPDAKQLAHQLDLAFIDTLNNTSAANYDYFLIFTPDYLGLQSKHSKKPFYIDFLSGKLRYRSSKANRRNESLAKAIGLNPSDQPTIVDATAGLGRDSFILATLGFRIILLERSAIVHALLRDALRRASLDAQLAPIISRLSLIHTDAILWFSNNTTKTAIDVVYIDPMFPERKKSASAKKEMLILQNLLGNDIDANTLFELSLACATNRVVVKRPRLANVISTACLPTYSIIGQSSRFDVYLRK